jgi:hypothetical protein
MSDHVEVEIDIVEKISDSGQAMLVVLSESGRKVWVPISVIVYEGDDGCDITDEGESGTLVVQKWFADKEGLTKKDEE